jgi:electron transfer flavoprotein alpha subunit
MKNVAIIAQTKEGQLNEATNQLLSFVSKFNPEKITIVVLGENKLSSVSSSIPVDVITLSNGLWADTSAVSSLANAVKGSTVFGIKSIQIDNLLSLLASCLKAELISGVQQLGFSAGVYSIVKSIFSGKASLEISSSTATIFSLNRNFDFTDVAELPAKAVNSTTDLSYLSESKSSITALMPISGSIPLPEAALVVGAGRGLKDPSNWTIVEDLAAALGAATACSKPVSDLNWRPHHEHVGQTGVKIAPNLYIACGISGAIQHLAGVNGSRIIVVINNDPEAPFFKHADYGIIGDVNEILPRLTKKLQSH